MNCLQPSMKGLRWLKQRELGGLRKMSRPHKSTENNVRCYCGFEHRLSCREFPTPY